MLRQSWPVRRVAREAGYADPEKAVLVLVEAGFDVAGADDVLRGRDARRARQALSSKKDEAAASATVKIQKPR
jgi:hypothetical protein